MQPYTNRLSPEVKKECRHVRNDIDTRYHHKHNQHTIPRDPVIDDPSPDPGDDGFQRRDRDHELHGKLSSVNLSVMVRSLKQMTVLNTGHTSLWQSKA